VSDADRERVAAVLQAAFADGRLTKPELEERLAEAYAAKTDDALDATGGEGTGAAAAGAGGTGRLWQDVIDLHGATPLLTFSEGHLAGEAAATRHPHGQGEAFYLGTLPDRATLSRLVRRAGRQAGLTLRTSLPRGVEAVRRGEYLFLISHLDQPAEIELGSACLDRLTSAVVGPRAVLAPRDVLVLACDAPGQ
jgi:beta-galactosidase